MKYIYVSYRIALTNKKNEEQILSNFNSGLDFMNLTKEFLDSTLKNVKSYYDSQGNKRTFTLKKPPRVNIGERMINGDFDSAFTGDGGLDIKDNETNYLKYDVKKSDLQSRSFLFLFYIPKGAKYAYLILQKKNNHAVKTVLLNTFNEFLNMKGFMDYSISIIPSSNFKNLIEGLECGEIKQVKFTSISSGVLNLVKSDRPLNSFFKNDISQLVQKPSKNEDISEQRKILLSLFSNKYEFDDLIFIPGISQGVSEISFIVNYEGISKTYYIKDKSKIKSNINVSNKLLFENGLPIRDSMLKVALDMAKAFTENDNSHLVAS